MLTVRVSKHFNVDFAGVIQLKVLHTYQTVFKRVFFSTNHCSMSQKYNAESYENESNQISF